MQPNWLCLYLFGLPSCQDCVLLHSVPQPRISSNEYILTRWRSGSNEIVHLIILGRDRPVQVVGPELEIKRADSKSEMGTIQVPRARYSANLEKMGREDHGSREMLGASALH